MSNLLPNRPTWSASLLASTTLAALAWAGSVSAQTEPDAATVAAARALAVEGVKLADAGDCHAAITPLTKAEGLYHSPIVASRLGECEIETGHLVEGTERLRKLLREPQPENASAAVQRAFSRAEVLVEQTTPRLAAIKLAIVGPNLDDVNVKVNGKPVLAAAMGVEFPVNPGTQSLQIEAAGFFPKTQTVSLFPGERQTVTFELEARPQEVQAEAPKTKPQPQTSVQSPPARQPATLEIRDNESRSYAPVYVSYAIGLVGLGVGAGYGYAAKKDHDALVDKCPGNVCPSAQKDALESARTKGTIATIALGVGGVGVVAGTIFLLVGGEDSDTASTAATRSVALQPWFGTDQLGVSGTF